MKKMSVKAKVTAWIGIFTVLISAIALAVIIQFVSKTVWTEAENVLREAVEEFESEIELLPNGGYVIDEDSYHEDQVIFSIYSSEGELLSGSVPSVFPDNTTLKNGIVQKISTEGKMYLTYDVAIDQKNGEYLWLRGILYTSLISSAEKQSIIAASILLPGLIFVAVGGGYLITRRAFAPMEEICSTAAEIADSGDLARRIELKKSNHEFYRLAELLNRMLETVEKAFEKEKQFTSDASHELRTPIAVIISESEYGLLPDVEAEEKTEALEVVLEQAKKMSTLIAQMLMMARNEKHKQVLEKINLSEVVQMVKEDLEEKAQAKNVMLHTDFEKDIFILAEQTALIRIFTNLVENAVYYGRENGNVWISIWKEEKKVKCSVKDDGIGIANEHQEKIFQRFFRVDQARTAEDESHSGLGLPMVKMLVENLGGEVFVQSELGRGAEFCCVFLSFECNET